MTQQNSKNVIAGCRIRTLIFAFAAISYCGVCGAVDVTGDITAGAGYSDNIGRVGSDGIDETIAQFGINLNFTEDTRKINTDLRTSFTYYDYLDDSFDEQFVVAIAGNFDVELVENVFDWRTRGNFGRTLFDPFLPARPDNLENIGILTTGPSFVFFDGARNNAGLDLTYSAMEYEFRPFDNERVGGRFYFGREIQRGHDLSLNFDVQQVEFDNNGVTPDVDRESAFVRYDVQTERTDFIFDLGYTVQEVSGIESDGLLLNLSATRQLTAASSFTLFVGRQFADQGDVFRLQQDISRDVDSIGDLTENGSPFRLNNFGMSYNLQSGRTSLTTTLAFAEQRFEEQAGQDRDDWRFDFFVFRSFSRSTFGSFDLRVSNRELLQTGEEDDVAVGSATFGFQLSEAFSISLQLSHFKRNSTVPTSNFDENRATLLFTYAPSWAR